MHEKHPLSSIYVSIQYPPVLHMFFIMLNSKISNPKLLQNYKVVKPLFLCIHSTHSKLQLYSDSWKER